MQRAWQALIAADWSRLRAVPQADIAYRSRKLADGGLNALFADLHSDLIWAENTIARHTRDAVLREPGPRPGRESGAFSFSPR